MRSIVVVGALAATESRGLGRNARD